MINGQEYYLTPEHNILGIVEITDEKYDIDFNKFIEYGNKVKADARNDAYKEKNPILQQNPNLKFRP